MLKTTAVAVVMLSSGTNAALGFIEWWTMAWCDFGGMYGFKDFACDKYPEFQVMIPAG